MGRYTSRVPDPDAEAPRASGWVPWATLAARLILGVTLLVAGLLKVVNLEASADAVRAYQILPYGVAGFVGAALPILEMVVGALLIIGAFTRISAAIGSALMVAFIIAIASTWARGLSIDCGCFGPGGEISPAQTQYPWELARDTGLLLLGAWTAWKPSAPWSLDTWLFGSDWETLPNQDPEDTST